MQVVDRTDGRVNNHSTRPHSSIAAWNAVSALKHDLSVTSQTRLHDNNSVGFRLNITAGDLQESKEGKAEGNG